MKSFSDRKKHAGGRPRSERKATEMVKTSSNFLEWIHKQKLSPKEPAWKVMERMQHKLIKLEQEVVTLRKNMESYNQTIRDRDKGWEIIHKRSVNHAIDAEILEHQALFSESIEPKIYTNSMEIMVTVR